MKLEINEKKDKKENISHSGVKWVNQAATISRIT